MSFVLTGALLVGIFLLFLARGLDTGLKAAIALTPFGASAVLLLGGLSVLSVSFCFLALVASWMAFSIIRPEGSFRLELSVLVVLMLCLYAAFVTILAPRIFAGEIMVYSLDRNVIGYRIRHDIPSAYSPLKPSKGNISQMAYFVVTSFVFVAALSIARKKGAKIIHQGLVAAAIVHISLGVLDVIGLDPIIKQFQTANYGYLTDVRLLGKERITAGFSEGSSSGAFSAIFAAYFIRLYLGTKNIKWGALGMGAAAVGAMSFSSTFVVSFAGILLFLGVQFSSSLLRGFKAGAASQGFVLSLLGFLAIILLLFILTPLGAGVVEFLDHLIFKKSSSLSGYERGQWALRGFLIGIESYGLGVGVGSTRSNGLISVLISNFGLIGTLTFFYWYKLLLFSNKSEISNSQDQQYFEAARAGVFAALVGALTVATVADPGVIFAIVAALSIAARKPRAVVYGNNVLSNV